MVVSGDLIEGTITPKLLERQSRGLIENRRRAVGTLPNIEEFAAAIVQAGMSAKYSSGDTIYVGSTEWKWLKRLTLDARRDERTKIPTLSALSRTSSLKRAFNNFICLLAESLGIIEKKTTLHYTFYNFSSNLPSAQAFQGSDRRKSSAFSLNGV